MGPPPGGSLRLAVLRNWVGEKKREKKRKKNGACPTAVGGRDLRPEFTRRKTRGNRLALVHENEPESPN
jgi:hypothetical protein